MNNALTIILILITLVSAFLYLRAEKSKSELKKKADLSDSYLEKNHSLESVIKGWKKEVEHLSKLLNEEREKVREMGLSISNGNKAYDKLFEEKEELHRKHEALISIDQDAIPIDRDGQDVERFLREFDEFVQSADISMSEIRLNAKDLIQEEYINVINGLFKIGLFPMNLQQDLNFDPKSLAVKIYTVVNDDPMYFKSWSDIIYERDMFIKTITSYVEGVINQRKINQAVDEALNGKEAASA